MKRAVAFSTLLVALLAIAVWLDPVREGLTGTYYANATWSDPPAVSARDPQPSNAALAEAWRGALPPQFSVVWAGSFLAMRDGPYVLATISDDGSSVYVDGQIVVDNGGERTWPRGATGAVTLTRGVHSIYVRYARQDGPPHVELLWARAGEALERMPPWALTPRRVSFWNFALSAGLRRSLAAAQWLWIGALALWMLGLAWAQLGRITAWLAREQVWPAMRWVLCASLALNLIGIWWGLPGGSWMPDELTPTQVLGAASHHFGNGWFDRYPPVHFYVLAIAYSPLLALERLGRIDLATETPYAVLALIGRLVSVAAAAGILVAIYACGALTFGRRAGIFAAAMFSVVTPFVYYAKSANLDVPYLFWFAVSLVFYLRLLDGLALRDFIGFAACATIAICTKDQAYGLYLLTPLAVVHRTRTVLDRRIAWAVATAAVLFAVGHNLMFNFGGFADHVRFILGPASESYRDFEPTLAGRLALLRVTADITRVAWGWPMLLISGAGVVLALLTPAYRRVAVWLALPAVSYYVFFVNVVLYNYDRFMLPVCLVLALFGGLAFDRWLSPGGRGQSWRAALAGLAFAITMLYAATVDLVMLRDSRYTVEQWLRPRIGPADVVGYVFPLQYYPRLDRFSTVEVTSIPQLGMGDQASYFVLNADYALAERPDSDIGRLIAGLQHGDLGYRLVFRYREPAPWPWLPGAPRDLVGDRRERPISSVLRHINPRYEVFKKSR